MIKRILAYWNYGKVYRAIEIATISGERNFFATQAKKRKDQFQNFEYFKASTWEGISQELGGKGHFQCVINTDKVLTKEIAFEQNPSKALANAFPGIDTKGIYYELLQGNDKTFVMVCRKEEVDTLIQEAEKVKLHVVGVRIGVASADSILPILKKNKIQLSNKSLEVEQGKVEKIIYREDLKQSYELEGEKVAAPFLLGLSSLSGYANRGQYTLELEELNKSVREDYLEKNFFAKGIKLALGILFFVLLVNMFFYTGYFKEFQQLEAEVEMASMEQSGILKREEQLKNKEKVVINLLKKDDSNGSFYINRTVANIPSSIVISELTYQPLERNIRPDKAISYRNGVILIIGVSSDKMEFSNWLKDLEDFSWSKQVNVGSYSSIGKGRDEFNLEITIGQ